MKVGLIMILVGVLMLDVAAGIFMLALSAPTVSGPPVMHTIFSIWVRAAVMLIIMALIIVIVLKLRKK